MDVRTLAVEVSIALAALSGCQRGSSTDDPLDVADTGIPDASIPDAPPTWAPDASCPAAPICPPTPPELGAPCRWDTIPYLECSYGDDVLASCRPYYQCYGGVWGLGLNPCTPPSAGRCPPSSAPNTACSGYAVCPYEDGTLCACREDRWQCVATPTQVGCPDRAPNAGTCCDPDAGPVQCTYGFWSQPCMIGVEATCSADHVWRWSLGCSE